MFTFSRMPLLLRLIHSTNNHTSHTNHLLFASHKLAGTNKPQAASWTPRPWTPVCSTSAEPEVFWCTAEMCVVQNHKHPGRQNKTTECETVLREAERSPLSPVGSACRGLPSWGWQSRTDSLRNVSPLKKALCPVWSQPAQNKERTSMFGSGGVWTRTECVWWGERLYVIVSAAVKRDIVDSSCLFVCLFVSSHVLTVFGCKS